MDEIVSKAILAILVWHSNRRVAKLPSVPAGERVFNLDEDAEVRYYDSDFGIEGGDVGPFEFGTLNRRSLQSDIDCMLRLARENGSPVLEVCAGTGRVALPLARAGIPILAVDISAGML